MSGEWGGRTIAEEIEQGRCVGCGLLTDFGYFCIECAYDSHFMRRRDAYNDERIARIRSAARQRGFSDHRAVIVEQLSNMQSNPHDRERASREYPTREEQNEIKAACDRVLGPAMFVTPWGFDYADVALRRDKRDTKRWRQFCEQWRAVGWQLLDDLTRPCQTAVPESAA